MKKILYLIILFFYCKTLIFAQKYGDFPCEKDIFWTEVPTKSVKVSSYVGSYGPDWSVDGKINAGGSEAGYTQTYTENTPWWEVDLGETYFLRDIKIWSPDNTFSLGMKDYYILTSEYPFSDTDLHNQLASPYVNYIYVEEKQEDGFEIPMEFRQAQFVRIQAAGKAVLSIAEIDITGGVLKDVCGNGTDDDCDGKSDCEDSDCGAVIVNVNPQAPTCAICSDGKISVQAGGHSLSYSIDGGKTWTKCKSTGNIFCEFPNLPEGTYHVIVRNDDTGCLADKIVALKAKVGQSNSCCPNGSFENGNFNGWVGFVGSLYTNQTNIPIPNNSKDYTIISSGNGNDPIAGSGIVLNSPTNSSFITKLGDNTSNGENATMKYCMMVKECNKEFIFNYALVLEDPDHKDDEQPFLQWVLRDKNGNVLESFPKIIADTKNPFFNVIKPAGSIKPFVYRSWTCEKLDLSKYLGKEICVEFITRDCAFSAHKGYAYIDGLCTGKEDASPVPLFDINNFVCKGQKVSVNGLGSKNFNRYYWEVCRYVGGQPVNCFNTGSKYDKQPKLDDVLGFFFNPPHQPANPLECGDKFNVTLFLDNGCFSAHLTKEFTYICEDGPILDYPDIIQCSNNDDIMLLGNNTNTQNCTFKWTPAQYLNSATKEFPTVLGSLNSLALDQTYYVTATAANGCKATSDDVKVFSIDDFAKVVFKDRDIEQCIFKTSVEVETNKAININDYKLDVYFGNTLLNSNDVTLISSSNNKYVYNINKTLSRCKDWYFRAIFIPKIINSTDLVTTGKCGLDVIYNRKKDGVFCGAINVFVPQNFSPNGDGINDLLIPNFSPNVLEVKFEIWEGSTGSGTHLHSKNATVPTSNTNGPGINGSQVSWDGNFLGKPFTSTNTFLWIVDYQNCEVQPCYCMGCCDDYLKIHPCKSSDCKQNCIAPLSVSNPCGGHAGNVNILK